MTKVEEWSWAEIGTGASIASSNQGKKIIWALFNSNAQIKENDHTSVNGIWIEKNCKKTQE